MPCTLQPARQFFIDFPPQMAIIMDSRLKSHILQRKETAMSRIRKLRKRKARTEKANHGIKPTLHKKERW